MTPAVDIYSFGMCALEMATLEIQASSANGEVAASAGSSGTLVTDDQIQRAIEGLEVAIQSDFIRACLQTQPHSRPTARGLLFHRALFEVSPLKLLAAHTVVRCSGTPIPLPEIVFYPLIVNLFSKANISETICDKVVQRHFGGPGIVVAEINYATCPPVQFTLADIPVTEKLEKFVEDVK